MSEVARASKRDGRARRRARLKNVDYESFNIIAIFERDGWKCQLCGVKTPKRLIGANKPNAPTHDHIVPVARGGPHTRENSQCLCRDCNQRKSDKAPAGQIGLFTALLNQSISSRRRPRATPTP